MVVTPQTRPELYQILWPVRPGWGDEPLMSLPLAVQSSLYLSTRWFLGHRRNWYWCQGCLGVLSTVDMHPGTSLDFIGCRTETCSGLAISGYYNLSRFEGDIPKYTHEWYRPSVEEYTDLDKPAREHIMRGGLLLREVALHVD